MRHSAGVGSERDAGAPRSPGSSRSLRVRATHGSVPVSQGKTRPRVLILIATDAVGGPGKGLFQFLKHAPKDAFDYVLCNFDANKPHGQFMHEAGKRGIAVKLLKQRATIDPVMVLRARRLVREHDINVIQTHGYKSNVLGFFLHALWRMPWIGFAHGYTDENWRVRTYNRLDLAALRGADRVVAVSDATRQKLTGKGIHAGNIRLIYNAVEPDDAAGRPDDGEVKKRHRIAPGRKVIGVIGRLNPEKGQLIFLKALRSVIARQPAVTALLIGDGQDRSSLEQYCERNGLTDHVIFTGYQEEIAPYYRALDLLVLPSLSEGLPNTVLEAMTFGVPVLASRVGGVPEIIDTGNGVLVPPGDPDVLAERMTELLGDDRRRTAIGARGRSALYPRFSPDDRARRIVALYEELLATRAAIVPNQRHA